MSSKKYTLLINSSPVLAHNDYLDTLFSSIYYYSHELNILSLEMLNHTAIDRLIENYYSHVIISGTSPNDPSIDAIPNLKKLFAWLPETSVPILGICSGHQIICSVFGGEIVHEKEAEQGMTHLEIIEDDPLFRGIPADKFEMYAIHRDSATLPEEFFLLASSERCPVHITRHQKKKIYTVQAHPEKSDQIGGALLKNFLEM